MVISEEIPVTEIMIGLGGKVEKGVVGSRVREWKRAR